MPNRRLPTPMNDIWVWQLQAACRGISSSDFFHPWGERGAEREARIARAKQVCAQCPVVAACRQHAIDVQEPYGIWGGPSEDERLILHGRHRRRPRITVDDDGARPTRIGHQVPPVAADVVGRAVAGKID